MPVLPHAPRAAETQPLAGVSDRKDQEPDVRFTYANKRTYLAWNRTALALIATGPRRHPIAAQVRHDLGQEIAWDPARRSRRIC